MSAMDKLVRLLNARAYLDRPCWLLPGERDLLTLYVPVDYGTHVEPIAEFRNRTVKAALDAGLATIGPAARSEDVEGLPPRRIVAPLAAASAEGSGPR